MPSRRYLPDNPGICCCPDDLQKICKKRRVSTKQSVSDIVSALTIHEKVNKILAKHKEVCLKGPSPRARRKGHKLSKHPCGGIQPPMEMRLRFVRHCDDRPYKPSCGGVCRNPDMRYVSDQPPTGATCRNKQPPKPRSVYICDNPPPGKCDIVFPLPGYPTKGGGTSKEELKLESPKVSGENINAQRAVVKTTVPPLPGKSGHDLFKPHSGIVLNPDKDYAPFYPILPKPPGTDREIIKTCAQGGTCTNPRCKRKKCRIGQRRARRAQGAPRKARWDNRCWSVRYAQAHRRKRRRRRTCDPDEGNVCGLDDVAPVEHPEVPCELKKGSVKTYSLTVLPCKKVARPDVHYGIMLGGFNMYSDKFSPKSRGRQGLTMSVMAYCLAFHYHPKQWSSKLINTLLEAGDQWYQQCLEKLHDHTPYLGICEVVPYGKKQVIVLNKKKMLLVLGEPEIIGYAMSSDPTIYNLCRGLKAFFIEPENRACILISRMMKVVIWRDNICYYIFDPAGRDNRAYQNFATGAAALITVKDLKSVSEILLSRSILEDQKFVLAPVKVLRMVPENTDEDLESEPELTQAQKADMSYKILNEKLAIVNGNLHLGDPMFEDAKFRQSLPIAITAMTYAKISPPNTWYSKTLDKIIRLGNVLYRQCAQKNVVVDLTVDNIPNEIQLGPYTCEIIIYRDRTKGQLFTPKACMLNVRTGLADFFKNEYNSGILDFGNYNLAVWKQKDMYYLFDPYPRTETGERSLKHGQGCCFMLLNTDAMAEQIVKNWDFMPAYTPFTIHAFKVLKLKKQKPRHGLEITLSCDKLCEEPVHKVSRRILPECKSGRVRSARSAHSSCTCASGDSKRIVQIMSVQTITGEAKGIDEEKMADITSLVDSVQDDYVPPVPRKYKDKPPEQEEPKIANLDSPTVSVTQLIPAWPKPRDKSNEPPEPDPDPVESPPPTPPPPPPPEGVEEEEEEEDLDEETVKARLEEELRRRLQEEEARRRAEMLPSPIPPPPPTPHTQTEPPLANLIMGATEDDEKALLALAGDEAAEIIEMMKPSPEIQRQILLPEDAKKRYKMRQSTKSLSVPIDQTVSRSPSNERMQPHNFVQLPDGTEIIRGSSCIPEEEAPHTLPFTAIMAIVLSYKYTINTWTAGIVDFITKGGKSLHDMKKKDLSSAPMYIVPKIVIGHQAYKVNVEVIVDGPTWQLEDILKCDYLPMYDRGIITTSHYSAAFFVRNGLHYLYDASCCNGIGIRNRKDEGDKTKGGKACLMRFNNLHDLVCRIISNKDGRVDEQQVVISRIVVRCTLPEARGQLPDDYDFSATTPHTDKLKVLDGKKQPADKSKAEESLSAPAPNLCVLGYQRYGGVCRIAGSGALPEGARGQGGAVGPAHFVCLVAMLTAAMVPFAHWDPTLVDICLEKGLEIFNKATSYEAREKRVIRNIILGGKILNVNIKNILVINENSVKTLEQYIRAVLARLRYVMIGFPNEKVHLVIVQTGGVYHVFDPFPPPPEDPTDDGETEENDSGKKKGNKKKESIKAATWTMYDSLPALLQRLQQHSKSLDPEFYTFELTSIRTPPRRTALAYKLSSAFRPEQNPNLPFVQQKPPSPLVDEKLYWLNNEIIPWSRVLGTNDLGFVRKSPKALWKDWDIELPGDLYSLWGTIHPTDSRFPLENRGKQYIACCLVGLALTEACKLDAWTSSLIDGIVVAGDKYHEALVNKLGRPVNHEIGIEDFEGLEGEYGYYRFTPKPTKIIFGFLYNILPDRFNLSQALALFFEKNRKGVLISPMKNLAFGKMDSSYFMFDCQSHSGPIFCAGLGTAYMLKCESLNRLIYVMTITLNARAHNQQFHLYSVDLTMSETGEKKVSKKEGQK